MLLLHRCTGLHEFFTGFLVLTYMVLVPVSTKIFYLARCENLPEMESQYLTMDLRLTCVDPDGWDPTYTTYFIFDAVMMAIYPLGWFWHNIVGS